MTDLAPRRPHVRFALVAAAFLVPLAACSEQPTAQYSYALKVELDDNGRTLSAESVIEVEWRYLRDGAAGLGSVFDGKARGEAIVVDLGKGRGSLFVLLGKLSNRDEHEFRTLDTAAHALAGSDSVGEFFRSFPSNDLRWQAIAKGAASTEEVALSPEQLPSFVRFANTLDPLSVREVRPSEFEQEFGPGVTLRRMTVRVVDQPATDRIQQLLPWLGQLDQRPLSMKPRDERTTYEQLSEPMFRQGSP